MSIIIESGVLSVSWFVPLFVLVVIVAIISKSLIANLGLIFLCVVGVQFALVLAEVSDVVRYGVVAMFFCVIAFCIVQVLTKVERL